LLFDRRSDGLLQCLRVGTDIIGLKLNLGRNDVREQGYRRAAMVTAPMITVRIEITIATIGRLMKN